MRKILILAVALALTGASCNRKPDPAPANQQGTDGRAKYANQRYQFSVLYNPAFQAVDAAYGNLTDQIVQIQANSDLQAGTNLVDAAFNVSAEAVESQDECMDLPGGPQEERFTDTHTVNGIIYMKSESEEAAAGNLYQTKLYRVHRLGNCIELAQTVHTGKIGNYPAGTVKEANLEPVWTELDRILYTFQFLN